MATVATRLSIDQLRSARVRRETYVGEWLPEPLVTDRDDDPARQAEMADSLSLAFLVLLESLSPEQRAALPAPRRVRLRLRRGRRDRRARARTTRASSPRGRAGTWRRAGRASRPRARQRDELARRFFAAAQDGDVDGLEALLAEDVVLHGDGGGKVPALGARPPRRPARGADARRVVPAGRADPRTSTFRVVEVNGQPGAICIDGDGSVIGVMALDIADGRIQGIRSIVNPDKLAPRRAPGVDSSV